MQFPHTHTTTRKLTRKKIRKPIIVPAIPYALILVGLFAIMTTVIIFTTSPKNPLFLFLFFVAVGGFCQSLMRVLKIQLALSFILTAVIEGVILLRIFQMATILNIVLVIAIGICFVSFAKNMN